MILTWEGVEEKYLEELLELHDRELITCELKKFVHQNCEQKEMEVSSKDKGGEKIQITID